MDNALKELESELEKLTPAEPGPRMAFRLEAELDTPSTPAAPRPKRRSRYQTATSWTSWKWANWTVAAGLVALLAVATRWGPEPLSIHSTSAVERAAAAPADDVLRPVRAARTLVDSRPDGLLELPDGSPVERVRDYYIDTIEWRDANGEARLRWELPRESVRFVALTSY